MKIMKKYAKFKKDIHNDNGITGKELVWQKDKEYSIDFEDDDVYMFADQNFGIAKNYEGKLFDIIEMEE